MVRLRRRASLKLEAVALLFFVALIFVAERAIEVAAAEEEPTPELIQPEQARPAIRM